MNRRTLLGSLAGSGAATLAGCLDRSAVVGGRPGTADSTSDGPEAGCPPRLSSDGQTRCGGAVDDWSVAMTVEPETVALPEGELRVTLENRSERPLRSTADSVSLYARRDGEWTHVVQKSDDLALELVEISPGTSREFDVAVNTADLAPVYPPGDHDGEQQFALRLPPGTYALGYRVTRGDEGDDVLAPTDTGPSRTYAATFEVTGRRPALEQSTVHEETFRRDGTLVVRMATEREYDHSRRVSLRVNCRSFPPLKAAPLSRFELYNPGYEQIPSLDNRVYVPSSLTVLLRDAFAAAGPDDDRIRVETVDTTQPPLGMHGAKNVHWGGSSWRLSATEGWDGD